MDCPIHGDKYEKEPADEDWPDNATDLPERLESIRDRGRDIVFLKRKFDDDGQLLEESRFEMDGWDLNLGLLLLVLVIVALGALIPG